MFTIKNVALIICFSFAFNGTAIAKNDKEKPLPPGLQKKVAAGKPLPPGWQKKVAVGQVLDADVYNNAKVILRDNGVETVTVGGKVIRVLENTREVIEVLQRGVKQKNITRD